jgi:protein-S-isoprenylcysteine O-methyltransferase Ste14
LRIVYWIDVTVFLIFAGFVTTHTQWSVIHIVGIAMAAVGFTLWILARVQLGKSFAITAQAKALVTRGLYAKFRHPVYVFAAVAFTGLIVAWNAKFAPFYLLAYCLMQAPRTRKEDAVLQQEFGEEYRQYKARTWF